MTNRRQLSLVVDWRWNMTTAQRKINQKSGFPPVSNLLNPIIDALKERGGKAAQSDLKVEVESKIFERYKLDSLNPTAKLEIESRLERALELLRRGGLICREGLHSLKLTSKALVVPKSAVAKLTTEATIDETPMDLIVESEKTLPLPDDISLDIIEFLKSGERLTALQIQEHVLRRYAYDHGILEEEELEQISRRALTARRILESKNLVTHDRDGFFRLTERGRAVNSKQAQRITSLSIGNYLRHQILKFRLLIDRQAQLETRQHLIHEIGAFVFGVGRYFTRNKAKESSVKLVEKKQVTYSD